MSSKLLLTCLLAAWSGTAQENPLAKALREQDYASALRIAAAMQRQHPDSAPVLTAKAAALQGLGRNAEAAVAAGEAIRLLPDYLPAWRIRAQCEYAGRAPAAMRTLDHLLTLSPGDATAHAMRGVLHFEANDCAAASRDWAPARAIVVTQPDAASRYASCLLDARAPQEAAQLLAETLPHAPGNPRIRYNLAVAQLAAGEADKAERTIAPLTEGPQPNPGALVFLAAIRHRGNDAPAAAALLERAIKLNPGHEPAWFDLAALCLLEDRLPCAENTIAGGLRRFPLSARLHMVRGALLCLQNEFAAAADAFDRAEALDPGRSLQAIGASALLTQSNQVTGAAALLRQRLSTDPRNAMLLYLLAANLTREGAGAAETREAVAALRLAIEIQQDFGRAHGLFGKLLIRQGRTADGIEHLRKAVMFDARDRGSWAQLAAVYRAQGRAEEARMAAARVRELIRQSVGVAHPVPDLGSRLPTHGRD